MSCFFQPCPYSMLYKRGNASSVVPGVCPSVQTQESGENESAGILKFSDDTTELRLIWSGFLIMQEIPTLCAS